MSKPDKYNGQPELKDGCYPRSVEYAEAIYKDQTIDLRTRIRLYIERWTWGFHQKEAELSQVKMAKDLKVDRRNLQRALKELEKSNRITCVKYDAGRRAKYGINKYYRKWKKTNQPASNMTHPPASNMTQVGGSYHYIENNKLENNKRETPPPKAKPKPKPRPKPKKKVFIPPELADVKIYFNDKGYSADAAKKFFDYYAAGEWHDGNGKPVKNWKQKAIAVWFKPENLTGNNGGKQKSAWERSRDSQLKQARLYKAIRDKEREHEQNPPDSPKIVRQIELNSIDPD